jgi:glycine dehydrogenase
MISIRKEIADIEQGRASKDINLLHNSPHTAAVVTAEKWDLPYTREQAAYPAPWTKTNKFWPSISRVDNVYGDRNLVTKLKPDESLKLMQ